MNINEAYKLVSSNKDKYYMYVMLSDVKSPFYVGIGKGRRIREHEYELTSYDKGTHSNPSKVNMHKLNKMRSVIQKDGFIQYDILDFYDTWEQACDAEIELIAFLGRRTDGGVLTNLTLGGDGAQGRPSSDKQKEAVRKANSKPKNPDSIKKTIATKKMLGLPSTFKGKKHTQEAKKLISLKMSGENNPCFGKTGELSHNFGRNHSEETKQKIKDSLAKTDMSCTAERKQKLKDYWDNQPILVCPYCKKESKFKPAMIKHHFDACKHKLDVEESYAKTSLGDEVEGTKPA